MVKGNFSSYKSAHALKQLNEWDTHSSAPLVQITKPVHALEETNA
jgi:hypothetical protein